MRNHLYNNAIRQLLSLFLAVNLTLITGFDAYSQGAAINTTGAAADPSAMLDVNSSNKGVLIPRMTETQKNSIITPATGLMIYQTDGLQGFWYFDGSVWLQSLGAAGAAGAPGATGATGPTGSAGSSGLLQAGAFAGNTPYWDGTQWVVNSSNIFNNGGSVGIGTTSPDASAVIDISSTSKGALIPRMTTAERNTIVNPATGLQIFNTTTMCFEYFAYGIWQTGNCAVCPLPLAAGSISGNTIVCQGDNALSYSVPAIQNATSYIWAYSGNGVTINGTSEIVTLDFDATATSGNLSVKGNNFCGEGTVSANYSITVNTVPAAPAAGVNSVTQTGITWHWNSLPNASGYKYNTANDYSGAVDNGTSLSYAQSGLVCNTSYTLYVWAYNSCGASQPATFNQTTLPCFDCGISNITFNYNGTGSPTVTYGTVVGQNASCWLNRNLGANSVATTYDHIAGMGDLFQWGRPDDAHQIRTGSTTSTLSPGDVPGHSSFILSSSAPYDWRSGQNHMLWQGVAGINNPCPSGWRVPTETEINNERIAWAQNNYHGAIASSLKMPATGYRFRTNGSIVDAGSVGHYWTSTVSGTNSRRLQFDSGTSTIDSPYRAHGYSVRCIKD